MSRPYIYVVPDKEPPSPERVAEVREKVVSELYDYLNDYEPEIGWSEIKTKQRVSKSLLMGPAGKLLSAVSSGRFENRDALIGFVVNIHSNTSKKELGSESLLSLKEAINSMANLRELISSRLWPRTLREIDYALFFKQYCRVSSLER